MPGLTFKLIIEIAMLCAALGFGFHAVRVARRRGVPLADMLGVRWTGRSAGDLAAGIAIAGLAMTGIFIVERALDGIAITGAARQQTLGLQALLKLALTFKEEVLMRSLLLSGLLLALRGRAWLAVAVSAVAFGCIHLSNPGSTPLSVLSNGLGGVIYGYAFLLSGGLWLPVGLHFAWNFVQGPVLGFPVSGLAAGGLQQLGDLGPAWLTGGTYGPEGGVVGIAFRGVVMLLMLLWLKASRRR